MKHSRLPEIVVPGKRLGRHILHDPRSFGFASPHTTLKSASWKRHCLPFDQGDVGSCTGNAMAGALMTEPFFKSGRILTEKDAVDLYSTATHYDGVVGVYPPDDTGSSGLAVGKAAKKHGWIKSYHHAFGLNQTLAALVASPVIIGIAWYEGFDKPQGHDAELVIGGAPRGGHEIELLAVDLGKKQVRMCNSWGTGWGDHGYAVLSFATLERLLNEDGDVVVPVQ